MKFSSFSFCSSWGLLSMFQFTASLKKTLSTVMIVRNLHSWLPMRRKPCHLGFLLWIDVIVCVQCLFMWPYHQQFHYGPENELVALFKQNFLVDVVNIWSKPSFLSIILLLFFFLISGRVGILKIYVLKMFCLSIKRLLQLSKGVEKNILTPS